MRMVLVSSSCRQLSGVDIRHLDVITSHKAVVRAVRWDWMASVRMLATSDIKALAMSRLFGDLQ